MKPEEKDSVIKRYSERLKKFGHSPETLGWDKHRHILRYDILLTHWELKEKSILDFGCGFGDMYGYLHKLNIETEYTGIDINPELVKVGQKAYPDARLIAMDAIQNGLDKSYDYIFSSGVHNLKLSDNHEFLVKTFELFAARARTGFAINFISDKVDFRREHLNYTSPSVVLELAYSYSKRVVLKNDYMPFEFTIFVDLRSHYDPGIAVYPEYLEFVE